MIIEVDSVDAYNKMYDEEILHPLVGLIKKEMGLMAQCCIQNTVIDLYKQYVLDRELSLNQVVYKLGFQYPQHFMRLF